MKKDQKQERIIYLNSYRYTSLCQVYTYRGRIQQFLLRCRKAVLITRYLIQFLS